MNTGEKFAILLVLGLAATVAGIPKLIWIGGALGILVLINAFRRYWIRRQEGYKFIHALRDVIKAVLYAGTAALIAAVKAGEEIKNALIATMYVLILGEVEELLQDQPKDTPK